MPQDSSRIGAAGGQIPDGAGVREKRAVAVGSVAGAVVLTGMKLVVGLATGSLGILSEAVHSALDLVAAVITFLAVRVSGRPADREHTYGHGKIENLSALFETLLLLATCAWILYEAFLRLFVKHVTVEATFWAFLVMAISIVIDVSRSRALSRVAKKYSSQALEADALHFSTDVWSSAVVIVGLLLVLLSERTGIAWLQKADAIAAVGVAGIVIWVSFKLGRRTIAELLDEIPFWVRDEVRSALYLPGVIEVGRVRLRKSGPDAFADVTLRVEPTTTLEGGHEIADTAELAVQRLMPGADVVVHVEPGRATADDRMPAVVREVAARFALGAHDILVHNVMGQRSLEVHLEVSAGLTVGAAHEQATAFEQAIRKNFPGTGRIVTHIEPAGSDAARQELARPLEEDVLAILDNLAQESPGRWRPHEVEILQIGPELAVSLHCTLDMDMSITEAHDLTESIESRLRARLPRVNRVVIHEEPPEE